MLLLKAQSLHWTFHARDKMRFYRLSEQRVRQVLHSPKRIEEGVAPKTVAMMQPVSIRHESRNVNQGAKDKETWTQEIWVMVEQTQNRKLKTKNVKVISAWRYPGRTKPRSEVAQDFMKKEFASYAGSGR